MSKNCDYEYALKRIERFFEEAQSIFAKGGNPTLSQSEADDIKGAICCIADYIQTDVPDTALTLREINDELIVRNASVFGINRVMYGMLFAVFRSMDKELPLMVWGSIHPAIKEVSYSSFRHEEYPHAVDAAFKTVEDRSRALWRDYYDGKEPEKLQKVIQDLFSDSSKLNTGEMESLSGKKYRSGLIGVFTSSFSAYRGSGFHSSVIRTKEEAVELIVLCSHFMYILEGERRFERIQSSEVSKT